MAEGDRTRRPYVQSQRNAFCIHVNHNNVSTGLNRNKKVVNGEKVKVTGNTLTRIAQNCCSRTVNRNKHANENEANYTMFFTRTIILYAHYVHFGSIFKNKLRTMPASAVKKMKNKRKRINFKYKKKRLKIDKN